MNALRGSVYGAPERHHTLDCNEGAIYGCDCECSSMCAAEATGLGKRPQDIHVCDQPKGHDGNHRCGCWKKWPGSTPAGVEK